MKLKTMIESMETSIQEAKKNAAAFLEGNMSASTRLRKDFMEIMNFGKEGRKKVIEIRNKRKEKKSKK
jgi:hypothetical protein